MSEHEATAHLVFEEFKRMMRSKKYPGASILPDEFENLNDWNKHVCRTFARWHLKRLKRGVK